MKKIFFSLLFGFGAFILIAWGISVRGDEQVRQCSRNLTETWRGYKTFFIQPDGKILRPKEQDVISEGQSNAMLRAVVMGDRETFDRIQQWTQKHLSREKIAGDHLLSWHYKDGTIRDTMPATDADLEYALALLLASRQWKDDSYAQLARQSLKDILDRLTVVFRYRRYLLPWIIESPSAQKQLPQNLSYYSPAYFKVFYDFDHDPRWLELVDTAYTLLLQSQKNFNGTAGVGLIPDWSMVDPKGHLHAYEGHSNNFSWEAVRIPFHIGLDAFFYRDPRAMEILSGFAHFVETELNNKGKLVSEYSYKGKPLQTQESPLLYAASYIALDLTNNRSAAGALTKLRGWLHQNFKGDYYEDTKDYYLNSLAWITEFLCREKNHDQK